MADTIELPRARIVGFYAENIKRLTCVEINPDSSVVQITGRNRQGKTSVLDAIWWAIKGTRNIQTSPIRRGCEEAVIRLNLGVVKITRKFKVKEEGGFTTSLMVEGSEGQRFTSPQAVLDALAGELSFDPLGFTRLAPDEQFNVLRKFVPDVDFDALAAADKKDYEARTVANRKAKELRAQAEAIILPAGKMPARVDVAALEAKLGEAATLNASIERERAQRDAALTQRERHMGQAARLRGQAEDLLAQADEQERLGIAIDKQLDKAAPLPKPTDVTQVQTNLAAGRLSNATLEKAATKTRLTSEAQEFEEESVALTKAMERREATKQAAIAKAKMPVEGLGFGDGVILLNGQPFDQGSDAEQLEASMAIAAHMNPTLRVIRVRDGSLLDDLAMKRLETFAEDNDLQVWIERVDASGTVGFVLEDGHLKSDEDEPAETF